MKNAISSLLLSVVFVLLTVPNFGCASSAAAERRAADQLLVKQSFERNQEAAVLVRAYTLVDGNHNRLWHGSGVRLGTDGLVLTNKHVAQPDDAKSGVAYWFEVCLVTDGLAEPCVPASVVATSSDDDDLALLRTSLPDLDQPLVFRPSTEPLRESERVYSRRAFSSYLVPSLVYGRYVGHWPKEDSDLYDLATMPGSSGSPVFDLKGRLVGLHHARTTSEGRPFAIAIPLKTIRVFLLLHLELFR